MRSRRSFVVRLALLWVSAAAALWAPSAVAEDPISVVVVPFDDEGTRARDLSAAIELELEFEELLLLTPWAPLIEEVGTPRVGDVATSTLSEAMQKLEVRAVVRAEPAEDHPEILLLYLHRGPEAEVVLVEPVRLDAAIKNPREIAVNPISAALRDLDLLSPLSERGIKAIVFEFLGEKPPVEEGRRPIGAEPDASPESEPEDVSKNEPDPSPGAAPDASLESLAPESPSPEAEPDGPQPFARFVRTAAYYSPSFYYYRACQPGEVNILAQCDAAANSPDNTELPLLMLGAGAFFLESFAIPFVGVAAGISTAFTEISTNNGSIAPFTTLQVNGDVAVIPHYQFDFDDVGLRVGARLGYGVSLGITEDHRNALDVTLLPSHDAHQVLVGARLAAGISNTFEVSVDLDAIPFAFHSERPDIVGSPSLSYGTRGRINLDILIFAGVRAALFVEGSAVRVDTEGQGTRLTRSLQVFNGGDLVLVTARAGLGIGFGL